MRNKYYPVQYLAASIVFSIVFCIISCAPKIAMIGSPYERYDHNRTQKIVITMHNDTDKTITKSVVDEVYIPSGSAYFPTAQYKERGSEADNLPVANVVPIFTGVSLPLSSAPAKEGRSDREDIIDFLAEGPYAQAGVQPGETMGDTKSAEITYKPMLDFLGSKKQLTGEREQIIERLSYLNADVADEIIDSRYRLRSFANVLALRYEKFWFILYKLPDNKYYSRLVVVPAKIKGQDFPGKRP
ncbi:MAG: hypothetical protein AB1480_05250 [Nitrospirota bacterium]